MEKRDERMSTMQNELFDAKLNAMKASMQPAAQSKGILEQAKELAEAFGMQPADLLKRFVGGGDGPPVKSRMSGTLEFLSEFVPKVIDSPIINALASRLAQPPTSTPPPTIINAQPQPNGAQPQADPQQDLFRFVNEHITGPMIEFLNTESSGSDFAAWVYNGFPLAQLEALQNVTHPNLPNLKGAQVIVQLYKSASGGAIWRDHLQAREQQFAQFVDEFCAWKPPEEEPATEVKHEAEGAGDVIDLDKGNDA